jgi:imidazolonepropionase-like amidohydrolase
MTETSYVRAGWLIDGTGEKVQKDVLLSIQEGRISAVDRQFKTESFDGSYLDLLEYTIIPGLVDSHVHLAFGGKTERQYNSAIQYKDIKKTIQHNVQQLLSCGIIAVRDGGDPHAFAKRYKEEPQNEIGHLFNIKIPGHAWHKKGRYGGFIGAGIFDEKDLLVQIEKEISEIDHVKIINSGLNSLTEFKKETPPQFSLQALKAVCETARAAGVPVMVHANGKEAVASALAAGCQSIEHGYFMGRENLKRIASAQVTWVPTVIPIKRFTESIKQGSIEADIAQRTLDDQLEQLHWAREYGVPVAVGTDAGCPGVAHGHSFSDELKLFADAGFTVEEIIQCATQKSSQLMNTNEFGAIEAGMPATFLAIKGTPNYLLTRLPKIDLMFTNGERTENLSQLWRNHNSYLK